VSGRLSTSKIDEQLIGAIANGDIRPNEPLIEVDLASRFGVSRTLVRESLQRLSVDDLIVRRKRGWAVREHNSEEIRASYEVRAIIEGGAARLAATRATDADLAEIKRIYEVIVANTHDPSVRVELNQAFHGAIARAAGNEQLRQFAERQNRYYFNRRVAALYTADEYRKSAAGHLAILRMLEVHDPDGAETAARLHVDEALSVLVRLVP
jgi:DNA-binding GntR family transcriptional regulator